MRLRGSVRCRITGSHGRGVSGVCRGDEGIPGHLRQGCVAGEIRHGRFKQRTATRRERTVRFRAIVGLARCGSCGLMLEICHQHGCSFKVDHTITACLDLLQGGRINGNRGLRWSRCRGGLLNTSIAIPTTSAPFSDQRYPTILGVNSTVMTKEKIATDKGTPTF